MTLNQLLKKLPVGVKGQSVTNIAEIIKIKWDLYFEDFLNVIAINCLYVNEIKYINKEDITEKPKIPVSAKS